MIIISLFPISLTVRGHLLAAFTISAWAVTYVSTKVLLDSFTPFEILVIRFAIGYLALLSFSHQRLHTTRRQEGYLAVAGLTGIFLYFLCENVALIYTYASNVGILITVTPLLTALLSRWMLGTAVRRGFYVGFALAIVGITIISLNGSELHLNPLGDVLALLAALVWAFYSVLMRRIATFGFSSIDVTRHTFFYGLLFMLPMLFFTDAHFDVGLMLQPVNLANLLFLSFVASAVCFATWNFSVKAIGAVKTSVYLYAEPAVTIAVAALALGEIITPLMLGGVVLIMLGLLLSQRG